MCTIASYACFFLGGGGDIETDISAAQWAAYRLGKEITFTLRTARRPGDGNPQQNPGAPGQITGGVLAGQKPQKLNTKCARKLSVCEYKRHKCRSIFAQFKFTIVGLWASGKKYLTTEDMGV